MAHDDCPEGCHDWVQYKETDSGCKYYYCVSCGTTSSTHTMQCINQKIHVTLEENR